MKMQTLQKYLIQKTNEVVKLTSKVKESEATVKEMKMAAARSSATDAAHTVLHYRALLEERHKHIKVS